MIALPVVDTLDAIAIPVACPVPWDEMRGDHRTRFCDQCRQNVHDVSEITRDEALRLLGNGEKVPCLRIYRRPDGRVMTADCATRRERAWKWLNRRSAWAAWLFALVFFAGCGKSEPNCVAGVPIHTGPDVKTPEETTEEAARAVIGGIAGGDAAER